MFHNTPKTFLKRNPNNALNMKQTISKTYITACLALVLGGCGEAPLTIIDTSVNGGKTDTETTEPAATEPRMMTASINGLNTGVGASNRVHNNKILVSWRFLPSDTEATAFDLYRRTGKGEETKLNSEPISTATCWQDATADRSVSNTYRLTYSGQDDTLDEFTLTATQASKAMPYVSIPLQSTADISSAFVYRANDASIGDVDGDGMNEIILKRVIDSGSVEDDEDDGGVVMGGVEHLCLLEAYRLDGTFLWRMKLGPNLLNRPTCFAVYDFDGDGRAEIAMRTAEGTVFGDGTVIGDTDGDGKTDYRVAGKKFIQGGPEFLSVIEGSTGRELARADYIALGKSEDWGDNYYNRSSRYRIAVAHCLDGNYQIIATRGCYRKIVVEAWNYEGGKLTRRWCFDTTASGNEAYAGQGHHSLSIADVDGDGHDEVVYGSMTVDHDGRGLNSCGYGHGDALHVGKFDTSRSGLQIYACYESGAMGAALRDGKTGASIWEHLQQGDVGRCLVADIDPSSPGCEYWWAGGNAMGWDGRTLTDLGYKPSSCNMAVWFSGSLNRQLLDSKTIQQVRVDKGESGRVLTMYNYGVTDINGTKSNPCLYADIWGDWREEIIMPAQDNSELRIFTTWYPTGHRFTYLMNDHTYHMSVLNQNIGYNMPTQLGWYLGSDLEVNDAKQ